MHRLFYIAGSCVSALCLLSFLAVGVWGVTTEELSFGIVPLMASLAWALGAIASDVRTALR
jgi:hypothetical protein